MIFSGGSTAFLNMIKIVEERKPSAYLRSKSVGHEPNDFGSRVPVIEDDPNWTGFTVHEYGRICTSDEKKRYK